MRPGQHPASFQLGPDALRDTLADVFAHQRFDWAAPRRNIFSEIVGWLLDYWNEMSSAYPALNWLVVGLIAALVAISLSRYGARLWRAFRTEERAEPRSQRQGEPRGAEWYLRRVAELRAAGRYAEALAYRFTALLLQLDHRRVLKFHASKTPAEYLAEVDLDDTGRRRFGQLVFALYRHLFGGERCGDEDLVSFDRQAADLGVPGASR